MGKLRNRRALKVCDLLTEEKIYKKFSSWQTKYIQGWQLTAGFDVVLCAAQRNGPNFLFCYLS